MRKLTSNQTQIRINEAAEAEKAGQTKSQWVNAQIKKAESQFEKDEIRRLAKLVWWN